MKYLFKVCDIFLLSFDSSIVLMENATVCGFNFIEEKGEY